ncbi:hypothetical protein [Planctomycetes bacterium TBK1r]
MRERCNNPSHENYPSYGKRGIAVCERWDSFENFLQDMGTRPDGHTIDRIDVNGDYEPGNCSWATNEEQQRNRRDTAWFDLGVLGEIPRIAFKPEGTNPRTFSGRLERGWTLEEAITGIKGISCPIQERAMSTSC